MIPPSSLLPSLQEGGLVGLPVRVSNEGLLRPRVARAQEINRPPSHPSDRAASASKKDGLVAPLLPNQTTLSSHRLEHWQDPQTMHIAALQTRDEKKWYPRL